MSKRLSNVTHVLGDKPTRSMKRSLYWCDGKGCPRAQGRKVGPQPGTLRRIK